MLPYDFTVNHLAGSEMGFTDYLSRNASGEPEPVSNYDEKFVVASIRNFLSACERIRPNKTQKPKVQKPAKVGAISSRKRLR